MSRNPSSLVSVFEAYGDDAAQALEAWANVDHEAWSAFTDGAAESLYLNRYKAWRRSLTTTVDKAFTKAKKGEARLFNVPESVESTVLRERLVYDGNEYELLGLAGHDGAALARKVAERDLAPSLTTVNRCRFMLELADHIDAETERLGRPVEFREVLAA